MVASITVDVANLVGLIMQSFLYGVYQVLFFGCLYVLLYIRASDRLNWQMLTTACTMWLLITLNLGVSWSRIMDAFIVRQPALREDPLAIVKYFGNITHWKEITRTGFYLGLTAVADSLFVYRLYVVWTRSKYVIILPVFLLCCTITSGIGIEAVLCTGGSRLGIFSSSLAAWATSFFAFSLAQNVLTTFLICYRIWRVSSGVTGIGPVRSHSLWPVMAVILESGAIYSSTLLILLATYLSGSMVQYIVLDMLVPTIGIVFNLIIVRVGLGLSHTGVRHAPSSTVEPSAVLFRSMKNGVHVNTTRHMTVEENISMKGGPASTMTPDRETRDDVSETAEDAWKSPAETI